MDEILRLNQLSQDYWNSNIDLRNLVIFFSIVITAIFILVKAKIKYEAQAIMMLMGLHCFCARGCSWAYGYPSYCNMCISAYWCLHDCVYYDKKNA